MAYGTSTLSFTGSSFEIQIVISDTTDKISDFRVYERDRLVLDAEPAQLAAARYDPKRQTISLNLPEKGSTPKLVLAVRGRKATLTLGTRRVRLRGDWLR